MFTNRRPLTPANMVIALWVFALLAAIAAAPVTAAVSVSYSPGAPDPGPRPGETLVVGFDLPSAAGFVWDSAPATRIGSVSGHAAAPAGDSSRFAFVSTAWGAPRIATLLTPALNSISFYWGSIDVYNRIEVLGLDRQPILSISGANLPVRNGSWTQSLANMRVGFVATPEDSIGGLRFISEGIAFEFDDIAASAVPEPQSWAMLIVGFGLTGAAARRRRSKTANWAQLAAVDQRERSIRTVGSTNLPSGAPVKLVWLG